MIDLFRKLLGKYDRSKAVNRQSILEVNFCNSEAKQPSAPWEVFPDYPAGHPFWRLGSDGEEYLYEWWPWVQQLPESQRLDYFLHHCPIPEDWILPISETFSIDDPEDYAEIHRVYDVLISASDK